MKTFNYIAKDKNGAKIKGKVEAASKEQAARLLREKELVVIKLSPAREGVQALWRKTAGRVTLADVAQLTRQFSTMITAGLPITDALIIIRAQSKPSLKRVVGQLLADVEGGSSLASALEKHPKVFSPVYVALVRAGEEGGVLDDILARLADNLEKQREFRSKVKSSMIYPAIVIVGMVAVAFIMMIFVVPRITTLYDEFQADLPTTTKILIGISLWAQRFWFVIPILFVGGFWGLAAFAKTPQGRRKVDSFKFRIPIAGNLQRQVILAEFTRTLGLLVGAGISLLQGLRVVSDVVGNVIVSEGIEEAANQVEKGFPLAYALTQQSEIFPPILSQMLAVGEETGKLDEVLSKVAHVFEQESEESIKGLTAAIEPIIMIVLGVGVAFLVIAIIMPIYNLTSQF